MVKCASILALVVLAMTLSTGALAAETPVGFWKTIDDETGDEKSLVQIREVEGLLQGQIVHLFRKPDEDQDPVCDECTGERKDKPVKGMIILWELAEKDGEWSGGRILDPANGKIYRCKLRVEPDGQKMTVRGYIGFSLIGRSQTWWRQNPPSES